MEGAVAGDHGALPRGVSRSHGRVSPAHPTLAYRTTPDVNPAFRRGGLMSFFRKQRASRPV